MYRDQYKSRNALRAWLEGKPCGWCGEPIYAGADERFYHKATQSRLCSTSDIGGLRAIVRNPRGQIITGPLKDIW